MLLDLALLALLLLALVLGHFAGTWRHLAGAAGLAVGYGLMPLWMPRATGFVQGQLGLSRLGAALVCAAVGLLVPALLASLLLRRRAVQAPAADTGSSVGLMLEGLAGSLSWGVGAVVLLVALLGTLALEEPEALALSDRHGLSLRTSRAFEEVQRLGLLHPDASAVTASDAPLAGTARPPKVHIDYAAMRKDPRLREALADPVVRHAMETGDTAELERRNRALAPIPEAKARSTAAKDPGVPDFIDPRDVR